MRERADVPSHAPAARHVPARDVCWHVTLLGGLRLARHGHDDITRLPSRAVTALLARLALAPQRAHAREELVELLWPGAALDVGRNRLRQALSTLKSLLEPAGAAAHQPVLLADRNHIRVVDGALHCDALAFEQAARAGRTDEARALYRGELLPGLYDEWIDEERLRLAALHERLPLHGAAQQAVQSAAASQPMQSATAPHAVNASTAPPPIPTDGARPPRVHLPHYLTRMFGADAQAVQLRERVLAHRLVTLLGPGGAGKTRLAVEVAHSLRAHIHWPLPVADPSEPFELIAFVSLVACSTRAQMLDALLGSLQIAPAAAGAIETLHDALQGRRTLLVLDNFEQLVDAAADVPAQLLSRLDTLHLLATSRRALGLDGEQAFALAALELPAQESDLAQAAANPAVALFVERARAVRADFHLGERNAATLAALVRELEGMPLAIELAAARVRSIAPAQMLARLRQPGTPRLDLLERSGPRGGADPRHASMQRVIAWSVDQLAAPAARLLGALTVFAGGFDAAAAAALVQDDGVDAALLLDELVAHSMLFVRGEADAPRFGLYEPIREFAAARIDAAQRQHWRTRLRGWALQWARALPATPPLPLLRTEMPNVVAAVASAADDGAPADAVHLLAALRRCLEDVELPAEGLLHAQTAVERCPDAALRARGHALLAPLLYTAGQRDAALRHAELGVQRELLDRPQLARALHARARVLWRSRRRADEVEALLDEAQALIDGLDDIEIQASLYALRAFVTNTHHRDHAAGERLHAQALALWQRLGNRHAVHSGLYNLAVCAENAGRPALTLQRLEPVIAEARVLQDWRRLSQSLNVRGNALCDLRDYAQALAAYQDCVRTAWSCMASYDLAFGLWNLPRTLVRLRRPEAAAQLTGFAAAFWRERFGELAPADQRYLVRIRRLCARQLSADRVDVAWQEGARMPLAQAVALALQPL
jgi:predicted ATPase